MSRTHRKTSYNRAALRKPKTTNEIKQIRFLLDDLENQEYKISGLNHLHSRISVLPTHYDDIVASSHYEMDYK